MDNSSVTTEAGFVWTFQYDTQVESWLKAGCKFYIHSVACGKDGDCWQAPFSKMAMLKGKRKYDCKIIFSSMLYNVNVELVVHLFK